MHLNLNPPKWLPYSVCEIPRSLERASPSNFRTWPWNFLLSIWTTEKFSNVTFFRQIALQICNAKKPCVFWDCIGILFTHPFRLKWIPVNNSVNDKQETNQKLKTIVILKWFWHTHFNNQMLRSHCDFSTPQIVKNIKMIDKFSP